MAQGLNNLANSATSYATNLTNSTTENAKMGEQIKVELSQNKVLTYLLIKYICGIAVTQS